MRRKKSGCTKAELQAEGGGGLRLGSVRLRIGGSIGGIYCFLAHWEEKQRDLLVLPCNFFSSSFLMWTGSSALPMPHWDPPGSRREPQPMC